MGHNKVYGICENKCFVEVSPKTEVDRIKYCKEFTYIVNSDASLEYWLSNKASGESSGGDDFTSVLIKKGTWTNTNLFGSVTLDTIGTLYVEGEVGSKLCLKQSLSYNSPSPECSMYNVNVEATGRRAGSQTFAFYQCANLIHCVGKAIGMSVGGKAFTECKNLTHCVGTGNCDNSVFGYGFSGCIGVRNCEAGGHCGQGVFTLCYASHTDDSTYACADTANGGFNDTTNPSA